MGYQNDYNVTDWENRPSQKTPVARRLLMNIENGIKEAYNRIVQLDAKKLEISVANLMVKSVTLDTKTGVLTVTLLNGSSVDYDFDIEKVIANFDITEDNILVLTLADGTTKEVDMTKFINTFASSSTISMSVKDRVVTAEIVNGSVTMDKLDAAIQTEFRQYMLDAQSARDSALQYQSFAKRYALGDETEFPGSGADNAKYYYEQSKANAEATAADAETSTLAAETSTEQAGIATQKATSATVSANSAAGSAQVAGEKATAAAVSEAVTLQKAADAAASETVAKQKAEEAETSARLAKRYAIGDEVPEDTQDNAKYYYEQSKSLKDEIDATANLVVPRFYIDFKTGKLMSDKAAQGMKFWIENGKFYGEMEVTA